MNDPVDFASQFARLNDRIVGCERCPRLRQWCSEVAQTKRLSYSGDSYWGRPVPNFGDPAARGLVVGLAPAAHGANRTGRMFTGDRSGDWLYSALYETGLANQPESTRNGDGLELRSVIVTATCHCAPPGNKPTRGEEENCRGFLQETLALRELTAVLCLGSIAWRSILRELGSGSVPKFGHGARFEARGVPVVLASYHPSQQNTFTGRLTRPMLLSVVNDFACLVLGESQFTELTK